LDLEKQSVLHTLDWDTPDIEWHGAGGGRGLRGIAFDADKTYIAASNRLLACTPDLKVVKSWPCRYLMHCHEIAIWKRTLYLTSSGFDSILGFDLDAEEFHWAMHVQSKSFRFKGSRFDPQSDDGPLALNKLHLNSVFCNHDGMYLSGLNSGGMLHFNGKAINMAVELPKNSRNTQPFRDGVLFNDTDAGALRYTGRGEGEEDRAMLVPEHNDDKVEHTDAIREGVAELGFARGLCVLSDNLVAGGSSPATVAIHDLAANETLGSVNLSQDARHAIHSIAEWPY
jgi:hypothetical protein